MDLNMKTDNVGYCFMAPVMKLLIFTLLILILLNLPLFAQQLAFPGAEGWGRFSKGGRGGEVYEVTNLNDSGPGSLREGVEAIGPRTIVFRVSGTIKLESDLDIIFPYITIAGQTAPGDGVCLSDYELFVYANHVIIRYLRFRLGDESNQESDAIWGRYHHNIIIDHCSASWSVDEAMSFYGNDSMTIQWCLVSESMYMSVHSKGAHGYGGIWGGTNSTFHHNLLAHHSSRNPRFSGGETTTCENVDFRNNVIYNWGFNSAYGGEGGTINMVANYFKAGPATKSGVRNRIVQPSDEYGKWYIEDNYMEGFPDITANNWNGGVQGAYSDEAISRAYSPFPFAPVTTETAEDAYLSVLQEVGANLPKRDSIDLRIVQEVTNGTATFEGYWYEKIHSVPDSNLICGIIDSQTDVGGWPELQSLPAPLDSDHDGMPDEWEDANSLNPFDPADRNLIHANGYTMLEVYLNSLVPDMPMVIEENKLASTEFELIQNYPNPFNPSTSIHYSIPKTGNVEVKVYNIHGQLIRTLFKGQQHGGQYFVSWNGLNDQHQQVSSGIYFCAIKFGQGQKVIKMSLVR